MQRKPNRYELPLTSMVGAMIVTLALVAGYVAFRGLLRDNAETPVQTVEYAHLLQNGKEDGRLQMLSPRPMPSGWRATSARYTSGAGARWHLGILTSSEKYVGIEEAILPVNDLLEESVKGEAEGGDEVTIDGDTWREWRGETGDYVLTRTAGDTSILVRSTAPASVVRGFVERLEPA